MSRLKNVAITKVFVVFIIILFLCGCGAPKQSANKKKIPPPPEGKIVRIAIALSPPGRGDKASNDAALAGLAKAKDELGIEYKIIDPKELVDEEETLRYLAENNYDLVLTVGFQMVKPLDKVAAEYPDINFGIIDETVDQPNVTSINFREQEGSFLAGVLATQLTQSGTVGFIGGADHDLIHKYENGFKEGVSYVNNSDRRQVKVLANYLGLTVDAFNDSQLGKNMADTQINNGADVIYHAARNSSVGIIDSAKNARKLVIGSDINQNDVAPGTVYTSMVKRVDVAIYQTVEKLIKGELKHGTVNYGLSENGLGLEYSNNVPKEIIDKINAIQQAIIKGDIKVQ